MLEDLKQEVNKATRNKMLSSDKKKLRSTGPENIKVEVTKGCAQISRESNAWVKDQVTFFSLIHYDIFLFKTI